MPFFYPTGEEIKTGDRVTYHGEPGEIEFVAEKLLGNPEIDWYVTQFGSGAMIFVPRSFGRVFVNDTVKDEDLIFVERKKT
jgi:oxalate decarboxylase/phosphoglucose isomerase-like protein (cupin superfamily)